MTKSEKIAEGFLEKIRSGELKGRLPAEQELARQCGVSPVTAAKALNILRDKGVVERIPGQGTFVTEPEKTVVKIKFDRYFAKKMIPLLECHFPQVQIEESMDMEEADGVVFATTIPFFPGEYFLPWPQERVDKLKESGRFYPQIFEFHHVRRAVWGIPYLFFPDILFYNKEIMRAIEPDFNPYDMTFDDLLRLQRKLPEGVWLFGGPGNMFVLSLIYNLAGNGVAGPEIFRQAVERIMPLSCRGSQQDFADGKTLFSTGNRHMAKKIGNFIKMDIAPLPHEKGRRVCHASSEALMVRNTTRHRELLFDMAEFLLGPEVQKTIGTLWRGIPADAAIAAASLDSSVFRDDIFFNEIKNIDYAHAHMSDSVNLCFSSVIKNLVNDQISPEDFLREVEESYRFEEKNRKALDAFMGSRNVVDF